MVPEQAAHALDRWRAGQHLAGRPMAADWQHAYAVVIEVATVYLGRYHTVEELVTAYVTNNRPDEWLVRLCRLPGGRILNSVVVADAAYWRRFQQLLAAESSERNRC